MGWTVPGAGGPPPCAASRRTSAVSRSTSARSIAGASVPASDYPAQRRSWRRGLDALGLDRIDLLAHSMGGYSACQFAIAHPERLGRLVLVAPAVLETRGLVGPHTGHLRARAWTVAPNFLPVLIGDSFRTGPFRWLRSAAETARRDCPDSRPHHRTDAADLGGPRSAGSGRGVGRACRSRSPGRASSSCPARAMSRCTSARTPATARSSGF